MTDSSIRLTQLSHGGGCGCKIAPAQLEKILSGLPIQNLDPNLLVGLESGDDAAVYRLNDQQAVVATTDFFMPIVDDPTDFGRIAATNALSDIYAVGGRPVFALAIVGMPLEKLPVDVVGRILGGGAAACSEAGISIAGGHSIDAPEPIYGLAAIGVVAPDKIKRNNTAQVGDVLILGKGLGIGILSAALKNGELGDAGYAEMIGVTTRLNSIGADLAELEQVHAMTDVTGFGLLGHLLEICRGSNLAAKIDRGALPVLPIAGDLARAGINTGAAGRNWSSYQHQIVVSENLPEWQHNLLNDPQTSGGLLVSVAANEAESVLKLFHRQGYDQARIIGSLSEGKPGILVE